MNPWAGLIIVVAILLIIVAWKGTQDNVLAAIMNRPYKNSTVGGKSSAASTTSTSAGGTAATFAGLSTVQGVAV